MELVDWEWALETFERLVAIPSPSGGEHNMARAISEIISDKIGFYNAGWNADMCCKNFPVEMEAIQGNLFVDIPGTIDGPTIGLAAYMDRVDGKSAKTVRTDDGKIKTDGNSVLGGDDVAGIVMILATLKAIKDHKLDHPPLQLIFTVSEEFKVLGAKNIDRSLIKADYIICFDELAPNIMVIGACGSDKYRMEFKGKAAHAGIAPDEGVNAIEMMSDFIQACKREGLKTEKIMYRDEHIGSFNFGVTHGGSATNVVPDTVTLDFEARGYRDSVLNMCRDKVSCAIEFLIGKVGSYCGRGTFDFTVDRAYEAWKINDDVEVLRRVTNAMRAVGLEPNCKVEMGGLDASWFNAHGIPSVAIGCGIRDPHMNTEYLIIEEFHQACAVALGIVLGANPSE